MRRPQDTISQQRLVLELKLALDADNWPLVKRLIVENPRSVRSGHVRKNIGIRRLRLLSTFIGEAHG